MLNVYNNNNNAPKTRANNGLQSLIMKIQKDFIF